MILSKARDAYYTATRSASDGARQLSFAGIGVIWVFTIGKESGIQLPPALFNALWLFVLSLAFDLLHYYVKGVLWGRYARENELETVDGKLVVRKDEAEIRDPDEKINWPTNFFYHSKIILVILGYVLLIIELYKKVSIVG